MWQYLIVIFIAALYTGALYHFVLAPGLFPESGETKKGNTLNKKGASVTQPNTVQNPLMGGTVDYSGENRFYKYANLVSKTGGVKHSTHLKAGSREELTRQRAEFNQSRWPMRVQWTKPIQLRDQIDGTGSWYQIARGEYILPCGQAFAAAQAEALACDYYISIGGEKEILFELWELDPEYVVGFPESGE